MKKWLSMFMICSLFTGCSSNYETICVNKAEVLEILEDRILVKPYDTLNEEPIYFLISNLTKMDEEIHVGDNIKAVIDTKIMMSYPGQVNAFEIDVIKGE